MAPPPRPIRPCWLRAISYGVRLAVALWAELELAGRCCAELMLRPRFTVGGACRHNGACCRHLLVADDPLTPWPLLRHLSRFWLSRIYRFQPTESAVELPDGRLAHLYTCDNLTEDRRCAEHFLRPMICRRYPRPRYFSPHALHRGCGYHIVDRRTGELLVAPPAGPDVVGDAAQLAARWRARGGGR